MPLSGHLECFFALAPHVSHPSKAAHVSWERGAQSTLCALHVVLPLGKNNHTCPQRASHEPCTCPFSVNWALSLHLHPTCSPRRPCTSPAKWRATAPVRAPTCYCPVHSFGRHEYRKITHRSRSQCASPFIFCPTWGMKLKRLQKRFFVKFEGDKPVEKASLKLEIFHLVFQQVPPDR
jgi:hypothetical protein